MHMARERLPASIGAPTTLLRGCTPKGVTAGVAVWAPTTTKRCRLSPKHAADSPVMAGASLRGRAAPLSVMARDFADKSAARQWVWDRLSAEGVARFPFPPHGRIPNFAGAEVAAARLLNIRSEEHT